MLFSVCLVNLNPAWSYCVHKPPYPSWCPYLTTSYWSSYAVFLATDVVSCQRISMNPDSSSWLRGRPSSHGCCSSRPILRPRRPCTKRSCSTSVCCWMHSSPLVACLPPRSMPSTTSPRTELRSWKVYQIQERLRLLPKWPPSKLGQYNGPHVNQKLKTQITNKLQV